VSFCIKGGATSYNRCCKNATKSSGIKCTGDRFNQNGLDNVIFNLTGPASESNNSITSNFTNTKPDNGITKITCVLNATIHAVILFRYKEVFVIIWNMNNC
jgi:hypothetical protein